jgi:5-(carboxyamino)imidazole ribonucleotide synthase
MKRVGILGGGQLGLMLAEAVQQLDGEARVYDPDPEAPAANRLAHVVTAPWTDARALGAFAAGCDVLTYEFENVPSEPLRALECSIVPGLDILETTQDRIREKEFLRKEGFPVVRFAVVREGDDARAAAEEIGLPLVLKTARGGYDGKGQHRIRALRDLDAVRDPRPWVLEETIEIAAELSCIVARSADASELAFPLFENQHREHVLDLTLVPARVAPDVEARIREVALASARALGVTGLLTVEFFLGRSMRAGAGKARDGALEVFVNEFAPRPHNSGHVTRNACSLSQYDALARILLGIPVTRPEPLAPGSFCMGNLLGEVWLAQGRETLDLSAWARHPRVIDVYLYGKREARPRRKMGHFVVHAPDGEEALAAARAFRDDLHRTRPG